MKNLVSRFTPAEETQDDDGLVTIEWALLALGMVAIVAAVAAAGLPAAITGKLVALFA